HPSAKAKAAKPAASKSAAKPASNVVAKVAVKSAFPGAPTWFQSMSRYAEKNPAIVLVGAIAVMLGLMLLIG
ncbi:MAG: hypothetical protein EBQ80_06250, partial [Proteobacteria bacterium]|nr:hypothetical protein [Pseudomonadota bacterium]